jgi:uncharacterized protein YaeQ
MCAAQVSLASLFVRGFFARSALTATIPSENQERQGMAGEASYARENLIAVSPRQVVKGGHLMDCADERLAFGRGYHHHQGLLQVSGER